MSDATAARDRIRDAALDRFGRDGVNRVTVRAIAADAGVSPALVLHHFGSKEGLRQECDRYIVATLRDARNDAVVEDVRGGEIDGLAALLDSAAPVRRYLARALLDESAAAGALFDEIVAAAADWLADGVRAGWVAPSDEPRTRAAIYVSWLLAPLVFGEHIARTVGLHEVPETEFTQRYVRVMVAMLTDGVFTDGRCHDSWEKPSDTREAHTRDGMR